MSTRSQVVIKDKYGDEVVLYRHSDGYPEVAMPPLQLFMSWVRKQKIRDNAQQASGWLIIIGAIEYNTIPPYETKKVSQYTTYGLLETIKMPKDDGRSWKCGAYEPTCGRHGDIEYLYILDLNEKTISCYSTPLMALGKEVTAMPDITDKLLYVDSEKEPWKPEKK